MELNAHRSYTDYFHDEREPNANSFLNPANQMPKPLYPDARRFCITRCFWSLEHHATDSGIHKSLHTARNCPLGKGIRSWTRVAVALDHIRSTLRKQVMRNERRENKDFQALMTPLGCTPLDRCFESVMLSKSTVGPLEYHSQGAREGWSEVHTPLHTLLPSVLTILRKLTVQWEDVCHGSLLA